MLLQPAKDDVVVTLKCGGAPGVYVIRMSVGPDQLQMLGREAAIAHALGFAEFAHRCAWITADGVRPVLIGNFRDAAPNHFAAVPIFPLPPAVGGVSRLD